MRESVQCHEAKVRRRTLSHPSVFPLAEDSFARVKPNLVETRPTSEVFRYLILANDLSIC